MEFLCLASDPVGARPHPRLLTAALRAVTGALTGGGTARLEADALAMSGGWTPAVGLSCRHRGKPVSTTSPPSATAQQPLARADAKAGSAAFALLVSTSFAANFLSALGEAAAEYDLQIGDAGPHAA